MIVIEKQLVTFRKKSEVITSVYEQQSWTDLNKFIQVFKLK